VLCSEEQGAVDISIRFSFMSTKLEEQATDLERIRNNQRRCRARQKEYIKSLEDRIRQYEGMSVETTSKQKLEELATENRSLKRLLQVLGLRDQFLNAYNDAVRIASDILWPLLGEEHGAVSKDGSAPTPSLVGLEVCGSFIICTLLEF
jgi:hypothetical protein